MHSIWIESKMCRIGLFLILLVCCIVLARAAVSVSHVYPDSRPYVRWWWFSGPIEQQAISYQLDWLKKNGFGGVEIAWVYPLPGSKPGPLWLSADWSQITAFTKQEAQRQGLGCDFTFGTLWPFGDSHVGEADASRTFRGLSEQRIRRSWELSVAPPSRVVNHLDHEALERYAERMGGALRQALHGRPAALFCDSWEVQPEGLWNNGLEKEFQSRFGYDLLPFFPAIDEHPEVRYDYRKFLSDVIIREFYRPFTRICNRLGGLSRVQCLGAPTDLLAAYAEVDVPESEAVLFDPPVTRIAASAALLTGKSVVSAEAFTCLYGWKTYPGPSPFQKQEQLADLKLVADALLANGANLLVWHGMPFIPQGGSNQFYASVHVGPDGAFARHLPSFNRYLEHVSRRMRQGRSYTDLAVYLPLEDNRIRHELPERLRRPSAVYYWELQYERFPAELAGYQSTWVTTPFLAKGIFRKGYLEIGPARFSALYVDVEWMDAEALEQILRLARQGLPVCWKRMPKQPGKAQSDSFPRQISALQALPNVRSEMSAVIRQPPLLEGKALPEFYARETQDGLVLFAAHPLSKEVHYPLRYGQSLAPRTEVLPVVLHYGERSLPLEMRFAPNQSLLLRVDRRGKVKWEEIHLDCPIPQVGQ